MYRVECAVDHLHDLRVLEMAVNGLPEVEVRLGLAQRIHAVLVDQSIQEVERVIVRELYDC